MAVYTETKTYHTRAHMGMIDVTEDFQHAVTEACKKHGISAGIVTGFTTGGVAALTTLEFEPGMVNHDLKEALDVRRMAGIGGGERGARNMLAVWKSRKYVLQITDNS